jgi:hypothetical protein
MNNNEYMVIEECIKLTSVEDLDKQIDLRRNLIRQMVGTLYPSILFSEIDQLSTKAARLRYEQYPST